MSRRGTYVSIALIGLSAAFVLVSLAVRLSRGHPFFIRQKLKTGALILSLTAAASTPGCHDPQPTCYMPYEPPPIVPIQFDETDTSGEIHLDLAAQTALSGHLLLSDDAYRFRILDQDQQVAQAGALVAVDGAFDSADEDFTLTVDAGLPAGLYTLLIHPGDDADFAPDDQVYTFVLVLVGSST